MSKTFNINADEVVQYTNRLEKLHRSHLPLAVRATLNDMAFDVKQNELMKSAKDNFIVRAPSFFKKYTGLNKAEGFDLETMKSEVGIAPGSEQAAKNLETQETGGDIKNRSTIYMDMARTSGVKEKKVRRANYLNTKSYIHGRPNKRRSRKSNFVAMAIMAKRLDKVLKIKTRVDETFFIVNRISFIGSGSKRKAYINLRPVAKYKSGRSVNVDPRPFLQDASEITLQKAPEYFIKNAKKRFEKALKI